MKSNADFLFTFAYFHYSIGKRKQTKVKRKLTFGFIRIVDYIRKMILIRFLTYSAKIIIINWINKKIIWKFKLSNLFSEWQNNMSLIDYILYTKQYNKKINLIYVFVCYCRISLIYTYLNFGIKLIFTINDYFIY